ncbi:MAG: hypothetical protein ACPGD8_09150 [Flavobacteriales bacterium]
MRKTSIAHLVLFCLLLAGCSYDAQKELDSAFDKADEIVVTTYFNKEEVTSIKFTYPEEDKELLRSGILAFTGDEVECQDANGRIAFTDKGKPVLEMKFHVTEGCNSVWIVDGFSKHHFLMDTALSSLLQSRLDFVKQLKGAAADS